MKAICQNYDICAVETMKAICQNYDICAVETMKAICQNYAFSIEKNNDIFKILDQLKPISVFFIQYGCVSDNGHTSPLMEGCLKLSQYSLKGRV